jgi:arginine-tRNA-protein transferase
MRQSLFTTHFLEFGRRFHSAVWLRVRLAGLESDRTFTALKKRNRAFRAEFGPAPASGPTIAQEALYRIYRDSVAFEPAPTLRDLLLGDESHSSFPTWEVALYDGERLVAGGFFDRGRRGAAGIVSYYDPAYRKHSLGKYLIYLKMEFCREKGLDYFYPGYLAPGEPRFDYKRAVGAPGLEYFDLGVDDWLPLGPEEATPDPLADMVGSLTELRVRLEGLGLRPALRFFLHLDINLNPQVRGLELFDYPVFLDCFPRPGVSPSLAAVHDPRDASYHLLHCRSVYRFDLPGEDGVFESDLLSVDRVLFSNSDPGELAGCLAWFPFPVRG